MTPTYKLEELAAEAGVSARTVRYYVQRGLLSAPEFRGKDTAYGREHLLRLQAVKKLQEAHLSLDEIQVRLEGAGEAELARIAKGETGGGDRDSGSGKKRRSARAPADDDGGWGPPWTAPPEAFPADPRATAQVYRLASGVELWVRGSAPAASHALVREILKRHATTEDEDGDR